ncbi:hypothetical protein ACTS9C_16030 [Empedobacter brevis]
MQIKILHNQTLLDIAIQQYGSATMAIDLAIENNLSLTDNNEVGTPLITETKDVETRLIAEYFQNKGLKPATQLTEEINVFVPSELGIGKMRVGSTFKVK